MSKMTELTNYFLERLKELYGKEELSDKVLHIVETNEDIFFTIKEEVESDADNDEAERNEKGCLHKNNREDVFSKNHEDEYSLQDHAIPGSKRKHTTADTAEMKKKSKETQPSSQQQHENLKNFITYSQFLKDLSTKDKYTYNNSDSDNLRECQPVCSTGSKNKIKFKDTDKDSGVDDESTLLIEPQEIKQKDSDSAETTETSFEMFNGKWRRIMAKPFPATYQNNNSNIDEDLMILVHSDSDGEQTLMRMKQEIKQDSGTVRTTNDNFKEEIQSFDTEMNFLNNDDMDKAFLIESDENKDKSEEIKDLIVVHSDDNIENYEANDIVVDMVEVVPFAVIPVHSVIMSLNSDYFRTLLISSGMKEINEKYITIQVDIGEGQFLQKLIHAFYDQTILNDLTTLELLHVLEIANRFSCDIYVKKCVALLKLAKVASLDECNNMILHINKLESRIKLFGKTYADMRHCCVRYLVKNFCPLENKTAQHDNFLSLHFLSLMILLQSNESVTWNENSLLMFVGAWLDHDDSRITSSNIETLLKAINIQHLTSEFLFDEVTISHPIFNVWGNFKTWFVDSIAYHGFSRNRKTKFLVSMRSRRSYRNVGLVPGWIARFDLVGLNCSISNDVLTFWKGYVIKPRVFVKESNTGDYDLKINITHGTLAEASLFHKFDLSFTLAIAVLPKSEPYNHLVFSSKCRKFIKHHFRQINIDFHSRTDYCSLDFGTVTKDFLECENGFKVAMAFKEKTDKWPEFMKSVPTLENNKVLLYRTSFYWQYHHDGI